MEAIGRVWSLADPGRRFELKSRELSTEIALDIKRQDKRQ
jgi:hypothetical protein